MTTTVRLPDGSEIDVATDDPKAAAAAARKHWAGRQAATPPKPSQPAKRTWTETIGDAIGDISDNMLPNWGDEIFATGAAARALVDGKDPIARFKSAQKQFKEQQGQYDREHPTLAKGTTGAGFVVGMAAPAGKVAKGAGMGLKMAHGAAVGAGYGGLAGAGEGESLEDRAGNAARGAGIGAAAGAAAAPIISGVQALGRKAMNIPGVEQTVRTLQNIPRGVLQAAGFGVQKVQPGQRAREQADRLVEQKMREGNITGHAGPNAPKASPSAIVAEQERRAAMGVPTMPADVTEPVRNLASWSSRGAGPGQRRVIEALEARKAEEAQRVRQHVTETLGPTVDPIQQVEEISKRAKTAAKPLYDEAYAQPMVVTPKIAEIMKTPAFGEAVPQAIKNIRNDLGNPEAMGLRLVPLPQPGQALPPDLPHIVTPEGLLILDKGFSTEAFDQIIRAMRGQGRKAGEVNQLTGRFSNTTDSAPINARAGDLRDALALQNKPYEDVTTLYADEMAQKDAMLRGKDVGTLTGNEINAQGRAMPDNAQEAWSVGARSAIADEASNYGAKYPTGDTANQVRKMLGDDVKQDAIGNMMGNTGGIRNLQERLAAERQGNITYREVQGNSRTAHRQALDAGLDEQAVPQMSSLSLPGMARSVLNHIASGATAKYRNEVKDRVSQIITETNPETVRELMAEIQARAAKDRDFADFLHRSGLIATKAYSVNINHDE